jgi:hypothetical protein
MGLLSVLHRRLERAAKPIGQLTLLLLVPVLAGLPLVATTF